MKILSDIEIAQATPMKKITEIAEDAGIPEDCLELYGNYKAKINYGLLASETAEKTELPGTDADQSITGKTELPGTDADQSITGKPELPGTDADQSAAEKAEYDKGSAVKCAGAKGSAGKAKHHLVLVTAITPTPAGEGKTTTTVGLADGLRRIGKKPVVALREPSLGPVFGVKGGAAGGGYAQVVPMEDINLHFTGDFHAIGAANNLLAAMIDNHIYQGNELNIDPRKITWRRCVDMNDRQLRFVVDGLGGKPNGVPREDGYDITVASEVMAILCLAGGIDDLKKRLSRIIIGYTYGKLSEQKPVTAGDLHAEGAMAALLKDALKPNLVQTLEHTPAIVHGGPFANIAHGCNSVMATKMALRLGDYAVTEAGFGADLGAEKFLDIKCRMAGLVPSAVVLVATVRALKLHGGMKKDELGNENLEALEKGLPNLLQHVSNILNVYHLPCVVAVNAFPTDTKAELDLVEEKCKEAGVNVALSEVWAKGGEGGEALAREVVRLCEEQDSDACSASGFTFSYDLDMTIQEKLDAITQKIYHGRRAVLTADAEKQAKMLTDMGYGSLPICVAKTQYSFSDDPKKLGAPADFDVTVRSLKVSAGAGFIVALTGDIMTMPGLPKHPAAERIDVDSNGRISGLF
ncbi:MAG TPA: formate--tetrahydrofolate ligase [Lachnospiraceae bacterium]|nr:formate--tetrahydrofolate ligase [Lachnospiraceae bacterium]